MRGRSLFFIISISLCILSCSHVAKQQPLTNSSDYIHYATGFQITDYPDYREIIINEPFKEGILARYYLVNDKNTRTPNDGTRLVVPLRHVGTASNTHIGFMDALNLLDCISGICLPNTIYCSAMLTRYNNGEVTDMGDAMQISPERALLAHTDAVLISGYGQGDVNPERLNSVGINVIYINEWTERTPLGRAEWIKLVGALFCQDALADSVFSSVEKSYNALVAQYKPTDTDSTAYRPSIMSGNNFRGTWYMSSGDSYMGRLFADAGADYYFQTDSTQGSIPLPIEVVLKNFSDADVWVGSNGHSLYELAQADEKHTWFKAFQTGRVYNFYRRQTEQGANDYWERGVVHAEELLSDLIWALYPNKMTDYQPVYIQQLQ